MNNFVLIYVIVINVYALCLMLFDKYRARNQGWRIPEKKLFAVALFGGAVGTFMGMRLVRHKTKHKRFTFGIPLCIIINLVVFYYILQIM